MNIIFLLKLYILFDTQMSLIIQSKTKIVLHKYFSKNVFGNVNNQTILNSQFLIFLIYSYMYKNMQNTILSIFI